MCGIAGFSGYVSNGQWGETHALLEALLVASECRGKDATGFVAVTTPLKHQGTRQVVTDKKPIPASDFVKKSGRWRHLGHQR